MKRSAYPLLFSGRLTRLGSAWLHLLLLVLLVQGLVPVQMHSHWAVDADGQVVELCTLQGSQSVWLDPGSGSPLPVEQDQGVSPAMTFSGLLFHAVVADATVPFVGPVFLSLPAAPQQATVPCIPTARSVAIRGPPGVLV